MTATLLGILFVGLQAPPPTKPVSTVDLARFDKKVVTVVGKIDKYQEKTSKAKMDYTVFVLTDSKGKVNVYLHGRPGGKFKNGDRVKVTGFYEKVKSVKTMTFRNEIDASNDKVKTNGVKPLK